MCNSVNKGQREMKTTNVSWLANLNKNLFLLINCTFEIILWSLDFCENISHWNEASKYRTSGKSEGWRDIENRERKPEESERSVELKAVIFFSSFGLLSVLLMQYVSRSIEEVWFSCLLILQFLRTKFKGYATNKKVDNLDLNLKVQCSNYKLSGVLECAF